MWCVRADVQPVLGLEAELAGARLGPTRSAPAPACRRPSARAGGAGCASRSPRRSSASRPRAAAPPGRRRRAAPRGRARASPRRPASPGAGRGCPSCGGAGSAPNMRVSGSRLSADAATWTACSSGAPMCGEPSETTLRTCSTQARRRRSAAMWHALRETSPPIECPTSATSSTSTGHASTTASSSSASERPFSEMWRPLL